MINNHIHSFENGKWRQNCYIVIDNNGKALIIDPGSDLDGIVNKVEGLGVKPVAILNTHAHYDHIGAVTGLQRNYDIPFYLHADDETLLKRANVYKLFFESNSSLDIPSFDKAYPLESEGPCNIHGFSVSALHTPGHTAGSVCLLLGKFLFSGDTMLPNGPGRSDLPGGDVDALKDSLKKLRRLPDETIVFPGHGKSFDLHTFFQRYDES